MSAEKGGQPPPLPAARSSRGRFARAWVAIENALALASFTALGGVVFLQFFTRYALNNPFGWTEEIARYLLIVAAYFGCVVAARRDSHIRLELAQRALSPRAADILRKIIAAVSTLLFVYLAWAALDLTLRSRRTMTSLPQVSLRAIYWPVLGCLLAMAVRSAMPLFSGRARDAAAEGAR